MKYLLANFKMNATTEMLNNYFEQIQPFNSEKINVKIALGDLYLSNFNDVAKQKQIELMAQNMFAIENGAYTGQISYRQLLDINIDTTLIGHSELRVYENQALIDFKTKVALANNLTVILCVGEDEFVYEEHHSINFVINQLANVINYKNLKNLIIAYEPIFAIGQQIASLEHINKVTQAIKTYLYNCTNLNIPVVYGGSVSLSNLDDLLMIKSIDGVLVGNASLNANDFNQMIQLIANHKNKEEEKE